MSMKKKEQAAVEDEFRDLGLTLVYLKPQAHSSITRQDRRFRAHYGASWRTVARLWRAIEKVEEEDVGGDLGGIEKRHLLWTLYFMKVYSTEENCAAKFACDEKTFRKYVWRYIKKISLLAQFYVSENNSW